MNAEFEESIKFQPQKTVPLQKSRFTEMLIEVNALSQSDFERWIFCGGMLFDSSNKWWGDHGRRDYPHEGIDLCLYQDRSGRISRLNETTRIPVMHDGEVRAMFKDFLGQAVIIEHEYSGNRTGRFISFYAHTNPLPAVKVGTLVKEGDIIATLADTGNSKSKILPHLHLTFGLPSKSFSYDRFAWHAVRNPEMIILLDPLPIIDWPYQTIDADNPVCRSKL